MKNIKKIVLSLVLLVAIVLVSGFTKDVISSKKTEKPSCKGFMTKQTVNMFVTHGHCSTPFGGVVENLKVIPSIRENLGNPLEDMQISFEIDPNTFNHCSSDELTARIKTPGVFIGENSENLIFRSTSVYTMGVDWYQVNGKLAIKGVERNVKFFVSGIRNPEDFMASSLVLEGQFDLSDWGIDYDKIVNGKSDVVPTKWMHINMKIKMI